MMQWQPREIQSSWADQISIAAVLGHLGSDDFDGSIRMAPRIPDMLLVPGDRYLYTPNDIFSSDKRKFTGSELNDFSPSMAAWSYLLENKISVHFKGNRKKGFFGLAAAAILKGRINPYRRSFSYPIEKLFDGYIEVKS